MSDDERFMSMAKEMASFSQDNTSYKKVGCVIVRDGVVVGRGYRKTVVFHHIPYRDISFHAEHLALIEAKDKAEGATLYNTMEPCSQRIYGDFNAVEIPSPCCELIHVYKIKRVVYCDPDLKHGGSGYLRSKNIIVDKL